MSNEIDSLCKKHSSANMIKQTHNKLRFLFFLEKQQPGDGRKAMNIKTVLLNSGAARHHGRLWNYTQMCITHGS